MKPPYTFEEILLILESARMDDVSDRLRELWAEKDTRLAEVEKDAELWRKYMKTAVEVYAEHLKKEQP